MSYRVYAATRNTGIYYCTDWEFDSSQPHWTRINDGLSSLNIFIFTVDGAFPERVQYCMDENWDIWRRRDAGAWTGIMGSSDAQALTGEASGHIRWFCANETVEGELFAIFMPELTLGNTIYILHSSDWGDNWDVYYSKDTGGFFMYDAGNIIARGNRVWFCATTYLMAQRIVYQLIDGELGDEEGAYGRKWNNGGGNGQVWLGWRWPVGYTDETNLNGADTVLGIGLGVGEFNLYKLEGGAGSEGGLGAFLIMNNIYSYPGGIWCSLTDHNHNRVADVGQNFYYTTDDWTSSHLTDLTGLGDIRALITEPGLDETKVVVGLAYSFGAVNEFPVYYLADETSTTKVNKSGSYWNVAPYSNSIPITSISEGICHHGLVILSAAREIFMHAVEGVPAIGVEIPQPGDRAVYDSINYPSLHANEIADVYYQHHVPRGSNIGDTLYWDGTEWTVVAAPPGGNILFDDDGNMLMDDDFNALTDDG